MEQEWAKRFRDALQAKELTMKAASLEAGLGETFVRDMLERGRVPSIDKFAKLAAVVGRSVSDLLDESRPAPSATVPIMGFVGAGAEVEPDFEQVPGEGFDQVEMPFPMPAEMIALQVKGDSMLPQFDDGMVIIVYREQRRSLESFLGEQVAVRTADGKRYIKTLQRGAKGLTLWSWNAKPIENVKVTWVGEIFTYFPASSVKRVTRQVDRQGGMQGSLKLRA